MVGKTQLKWLSILLLFTIYGCEFSDQSFESDFNDNLLNKEFGIFWSNNKTLFRVWSPKADFVKLNLFDSYDQENPTRKFNLIKKDLGVWELELNLDLKNIVYSYQFSIDGFLQEETAGMYAYACTPNGERGVILNKNDTNPLGWESDESPDIKNREAIIYKLHVRDFTQSNSTSNLLKGKFLGLAEPWTTNPSRETSGIDHIVDLGITHILLYPINDFQGIDETSKRSFRNSKGYLSQHYMIPEGTYSTDAFEPATRIKEFKLMVQEFHRRGIKVTMMLNFANTGNLIASALQSEYPNYYFRKDRKGNFSKTKLANNELATEKLALKKYFLDVINFWINEFHIDGFFLKDANNFDYSFLQYIIKETKANHKDILMMTEGSGSSTKERDSKNIFTIEKYKDIDHISIVNKLFQDITIGNIYNNNYKSVFQMNTGNKHKLQLSLISQLKHPQLINLFSHEYFNQYGLNTSKAMIYANSNDDLTIYDKISSVFPNDSIEDIVKKQIIVNALVLNATGIPMLNAGQEFLRSKGKTGISNLDLDQYNNIDWRHKSTYKKLYDFTKSMIQFRKDCKVFNIEHYAEVSEIVDIVPTIDNEIIVMRYFANDNFEESIFAIYNFSNNKKIVNLPKGLWRKVLSTDFKYDGIENQDSEKYAISFEADRLSVSFLVGKKSL